MVRLLLLWVVGLLATYSCKAPEDSVGNRPPSIRLFVDQVNVPDSLRLGTRVRLHWTGTDADGYVKGYKLGWGSSPAEAGSRLQTSPLVKVSDSTFLFSFGGGDTASIHFTIVAVDDKDAVSATPAKLRIPVRNSLPSISARPDGLPASDSVHILLSFPFRASDPDGDDNIRQVQVRINENAWVNLPLSVNFISLVPKNPQPGETSALVYAGENLASLNQEPSPLPGLEVPGLRMGQKNRIELRVVDLAGADARDTLDKDYFFVPRSGDVLLVDAYRNETAVGDTLYSSMVGAVATFDRVDYASAGGRNAPLFWNSTFYLLCRQYKSVFWFSDILTNLPGQNPILLSSAAASFNQHLRFNGKVLISAIFPDGENQLSADDQSFSLIPVKRFFPQSDAVRLRRNQPVLSKASGFSNLITTNNTIPVIGIDVFEPQDGADSLYFLPSGSLVNLPGPGMLIGARTRNPFSNRTNLAFFAIEITNLYGSRPALISFFDRLLNNEFNW